MVQNHKEHHLQNILQEHQKKHFYFTKNTWLLYFYQHGQAFFSVLKRFRKNPLSYLGTVAVIAIALALPLGFKILLSNIHVINDNINETKKISLYLKKEINDAQATALTAELKTKHTIKSARYISPDEGLQEFASASQSSEALATLEENPLPGAIIVIPQDYLTSKTQLESLYGELKSLPEVAYAELDTVWLERLNYLLDLAKRLETSLMILFGAGIILISGNAIRLSLRNAEQEIAILKLVGAENSYIRRPFLYLGFCFGVAGSLVAWLIVSLIIESLNVPVRQLALTYASNFFLQNLSIWEIAKLLALTGFLGLLGAWGQVLIIDNSP